MLRPLQNLLVTGGAGFIGSAFVRFLLCNSAFRGRIVTLDALTYAGNLENLSGFLDHPRHLFIRGDIKNQSLVEKLVEEKEIDTLVHFAAETHVDRSIASAESFIETNVQGTLALLEVVRKVPQIHFHQISTDEVYGSLGENGTFQESSPYRPNSPYAASKASADHLVRAFAHTYGLSTTLSHCCNNYGPRQYPEKFIPLMITKALQGAPLPIYGRGAQVREWLYVGDHARAVWTILQFGKKGEHYNIGGKDELTNLELLHLLLKLLAQETNRDPDRYHSLIRFVTDRPGHDFRYALSSHKMEKLGWHPEIPFEAGLKRTLRWYLKRYYSKDHLETVIRYKGPG